MDDILSRTNSIGIRGLRLRPWGRLSLEKQEQRLQVNPRHGQKLRQRKCDQRHHKIQSCQGLGRTFEQG